MLEKLTSPEHWTRFLSTKLNNEYITDQEKKLFSSFVLEKKYEPMAKQIEKGGYSFSIPKRHIISKHHSNKKRIVYSYTEEEMLLLKYIAYLLYDYDYLFTKNLYSFRKSTGVHHAIHALKNTRSLQNMYGYKLDISNYFNSIDISLLLPDLKESIEADIYALIEKLLTETRVETEDGIIEEEKGIMAGVPLSAFLANFYIRSIDEYFSSCPVLYMRYADDIILFANTEEEIHRYSQKLKEMLIMKQLSINPDKEMLYQPGDTFEFLGFSFQKNGVDISVNSIRKMKARIRRSARGIRRWMLRKNAAPKAAVKGMLRKYNYRFFGSDHTELCWRYWFFPEITLTAGLHQIDAYLQEELRYIVTGRHNKRNLEKVPYSFLKECGYKSLVHEYYLFLDMEN